LGVAVGHCESRVQPLPGVGTQPPFTHVVPAGQVVVAEQPFTHWPFSQTSPAGHSLSYLQMFFGSVHVPPTHCWPFEQFAFDVQGQGPFVPPHAWQWFWMQTWPLAQSALPVHCSGAPPSVLVGAMHMPDLQTVPFGQSPSAWHVCSQPCVVHTCPVGQPDEPVQGLGGGALTGLHP
jgi:hypothetical protein